MTPSPATEPAALKLIREMYAMLGDHLANRHDPFAELKAAHRAGKTIQLCIADEWLDIPKDKEPSWFFVADAWRIKPEGDWREHDGGPCPVEPAAMVEVKWLDGTVESGQAQHFLWDHRRGPGGMPSTANIIAWRPAVPQSRRVAWSQPSDVPLNCWIRTHPNSYPKSCSQVVGICDSGVTISGTLIPNTKRELHVLTWHDLKSAQYSTDRINWQPCTREAAPEAS